MATNCAPLLADCFYTFMGHTSRLPNNKDRKLAQNFNSSFRYIDHVLSINNSRFGDYLHRISPNELEIKNTTDTQVSALTLTITLKSTTDEG